MNLFVLNTQDGTTATVASEASTPLALNAGQPALIYVRAETPIAAGDLVSVVWTIEGDGAGVSNPTLEIQAGGTTSKVANRVVLGALLAGTYLAVVVVTVGSGTSAGVYSVRLPLTVTSPALPGTAAVPSIRRTYPTRVMTEGHPLAAFHLTAGLPVWIGLSACNAPTAWTAVQIPAGLTINNSGVVSGSIAASGNYDLTVYASNAAGNSLSVSFPLIVTDPVPGVFTPAAAAALALAGFDAKLTDLQFALRSRLLLSAALAACGGGLKVGDTPTFALLPSLAGTPITSGVTAITLSIKPKDKPYAAAFVSTTIASPGAATVSGGRSYWPIAVTLSGANIDSAFYDLNTDSDAAEAPLPAVRALPCDLELRLTYSGGIYTAITYPFTLLQSLISAPGI